MTQKIRLDLLLVEKDLCDSRAKAQGLILAGKVLVNGQRVDKAGTLVSETAEIAVSEGLKYVSRGGLKLEKALEVFQVNPSGVTCLDIGAATGGFTDCLLQNGAAKVYAVDVGYGQLAWKLREDPRVVVMEKTNVRLLSASMLADKLDLIVCDASFISLKKTLPVVAQSGFLSEKPQIIALLKPQFEHKDYVDDPGFKGVVREAVHHKAIITGVLGSLQAAMPGWGLFGLDYSPITGPEGNIEFLIWLKRTENEAITALEEPVEAVVTKGYAQFGRSG